MRINKGFTHGGIFHADDVFATAFLKIIEPGIEITRGFQVPDSFDGIIYDIGFGEFDHHQKDKEVRENGIPYAAFGLVFRRFGTEVMGAEDAEEFDRDFIQSLDESDNTGKPNPISKIITDFNPVWNIEEDTEAAFAEAVEWAKLVLEKRFRTIRSNREAYEQVREIAMEAQKEHVLFLERAMPWKKAVSDLAIDYVVFPSDRGGYVVQAVSANHGIQLKKPFPKEWRGRTAQELQQLTGITDFTFCHNSGFLCALGSLEGVRTLLQIL